MARIPTRDNVTTQSPAGIPNVRLSAAPNAEQLGYSNRVPNEGARRDLSSALGSYGDALEKIQKRKDNTQVLSVLAEAQKASAKQQAQIAGRKGSFAEGATDDTEAWFKEQYPEYTGRLQNERQKRSFDQEWSRLNVNSAVSASKHEEVQGQVALSDAAKAAVVGAIELSAANPTDEEALADYRGQVLVASQNVSAAAGHKAGSARAALDQLDNLSALHDNVIGALIKNDPSAAETYLQKFSGEMNASTKQRVTKLVETSKRLKLGQTTADEYVASGLSEADAVAKARKDFQGEEERDVVMEVKTRYIEHNAARERTQRNAADEAWKVVANSGSMSGIPAQVLESMDGKDIAAIRRSIEAKAASEESRAAARAGRAAAVESRAAAVESRAYTKETRERTKLDRAGQDRYEELRAMAVIDPENFKKVDFRRENDTLNGTQIASLSTLRDKPPVKDFLTYTQQLGRATETLNKKDKQAFQMDLDRKMDAATQTKGKDLTQEERQVLIDTAQVEFKVDANWWPDSKVKNFEVKPEQRERLYLPDMPDLPKEAVAAVFGGVPKDKIQALADQFTKRGVKMTPELLLRQYQYENQKK